MSSTDRDLVILIDEADRPVGTMDKLAAHRAGTLHSAISVIVADSAGRLLLQRRAEAKYHSGGLWTNTCCSHPRPGEPVDVAAARRLDEEMGLTCALTPLFIARYRAPVSNGLIEDELVHVYGGRFDGAPSPDPAEVEDWRFADLAEIRRDTAERPEAYTVWFRKYVEEFAGQIARLSG